MALTLITITTIGAVSIFMWVPVIAVIVTAEFLS